MEIGPGKGFIGSSGYYVEDGNGYMLGSLQRAVSCQI